VLTKKNEATTYQCHHCRSHIGVSMRKNVMCSSTTASSKIFSRLVKKHLMATFKTLDCKGVLLSPGWADMRAALREPGFEFKEDLVSASKAAVAGGYTIVACLPSTLPAIQTKADVEFIYRKAEPLPVHILPYGSLSKNREGNDMNELYDMYKAGAVAFTDANKPVEDAGLMLRSLMYSKLFNGLILSHADDTSLSTWRQNA
jgi:dihydroorotase